jgi:manganese/iron transport system ATP-binding protein
LPTSPDPGSGPAPALVLDDVTVRFGPFDALDGVTATVAPGQSVALIGPNGAGKSTLLRSILGLVPLARGSIRVLGREPADARRDVAYVPQAESLDPEFPVSVAQVVLMGRYRAVGWLRRPGRNDRDLAAAALERVGLTDRAGDRFGTLSGGQQQRVLIARAVAQQSRLLLLDEPFNGVDSVTQSLLLDVLGELRADGVAVVMSTHDLTIAHLACDEACLLNRHQVAFGPVADTLTPALLQQTYGARAMVLAGDAVVVAPS